MLIAKIADGAVERVDHYRTLFPYTVFPDSGPSDQWLVDNSCLKVNLFLPHDRDTQVLDRVDPYILDGWVYTVQVRDMNEEELAAHIASKAAQKRAERDQALADCDWRVIRSVELSEPLNSNWAAYRQVLRDLPQAEGFPDVSLPAIPGYTAGNNDSITLE
jgi:hypothetical protein